MKLAPALAALIAVVWGVCFVIIQAALPSPAPLLLAAARSMLGGAVLAAWLAVRWRRIDLSHLRARLPSATHLALLAVTNSALAFGAMYLAAGRAEAAAASVVAGTQPLLLALAGWALFAERMAMRTILGLAVATAGLMLVATAASGPTSLDGLALAFLAAAAPAIGTVLMRRLAPSVDLLAVTAAQFLIGGAVLLVASAAVEPWVAVRWSAATVGGLLVLGIVGTGLAYAAWFWLLPRMSLARLATALYLVPVTGVAAAVIGGERPAPAELLGTIVLLVGMGLVSTDPRTRLAAVRGP